MHQQHILNQTTSHLLGYGWFSGFKSNLSNPNCVENVPSQNMPKLGSSMILAYHKYKLILIFKSRSISVETLKSKLFFSGRLMASISCSLSFCPVPTKEICTCCCGSCMNVTGNQGVGKGLGSGAVILSERERKEGCGMVEDYPHVHTQDCVHGPGHPFPFSSHHSVPMSSSSLRAIGSPKF